MTKLPMLVAALLGALAVACLPQPTIPSASLMSTPRTGEAPDSPATGTPSVTDVPSQSHEAQSPEPSPLRLDMDTVVAGMPDGHFAVSTTAVCDGLGAATSPGDADWAVPCGDALNVGQRVARLLASADPGRLYLRRPQCTSCSEDELARGVVSVWVGDTAFDVEVDARETWVTVTEVGAGAAWPRGGDALAPARARPELPAAPPILAERASLPFCGEDPDALDGQASTCFRDAVVNLRPAELIASPPTGEVLWVYRFEGRGAVERFQFDNGRWRVTYGALNLRGDGEHWDFEPWPELERALD